MTNLKPSAAALLASLPRRVCCSAQAAEYTIALALNDMRLVTVTEREVKSGRVSYLVSRV